MAYIIPYPESYAGEHTVMVVDDDPGIRAIVCAHLEECGFIAVSADSGDQARAKIKAGIHADIVFSDVRMPGELDGFGLARWLMENHPSIPIILASGDVGKKNALHELCGAEMVAKPYDFDVVARRIRGAIRLSKSRH